MIKKISYLIITLFCFGSTVFGQQKMKVVYDGQQISLLETRTFTYSGPTINSQTGSSTKNIAIHISDGTKIEYLITYHSHGFGKGKPRKDQIPIAEEMLKDYLKSQPVLVKKIEQKNFKFKWRELLELLDEYHDSVG